MTTAKRRPPPSSAEASGCCCACCASACCACCPSPAGCCASPAAPLSGSCACARNSAAAVAPWENPSSPSMGACSRSAAAMAACDVAQPVYCAAREGQVPGSRSDHCLHAGERVCTAAFAPPVPTLHQAMPGAPHTYHHEREGAPLLPPFSATAASAAASGATRKGASKNTNSARLFSPFLNEPMRERKTCGGHTGCAGGRQQPQALCAGCAPAHMRQPLASAFCR